MKVFAKYPQGNALCISILKARPRGLSAVVLDLDSLGLNVLSLTPLSFHFLIRKIRIIIIAMLRY